MNWRKHFSILGMLLLAVLVAGCSLPISSTPTPFVFPTPNMTMTAIFKPQLPPTVTPPAVQTATQPPATQPPAPTATLRPTNPAPAPAPTITPLSPTRTNIPTNMRLGPSGTAVYLSTAPTIDGPWDEWTSTQYPIKNVVFGAKNWTGASDLQGAYRIGWDATNLYVAVKVNDDKYVQNATGANLYKGDSIEILLDTNVTGDFFTQSLTSDDYQLGISAGTGQPGHNPEAYLWFPTSKAGSVTKVKIGAVGGTGVYRVEAAIPWSVFGVTPASGNHFGFAISISDNDNSSENVQQTMISNDPNRVLTDPTTWGDLTLKK